MDAYNAEEFRQLETQLNTSQDYDPMNNDHNLVIQLVHALGEYGLVDSIGDVPIKVAALHQVSQLPCEFGRLVDAFKHQWPDFILRPLQAMEQREQQPTLFGQRFESDSLALALSSLESNLTSSSEEVDEIAPCQPRAGYGSPRIVHSKRIDFSTLKYIDREPKVAHEIDVLAGSSSEAKFLKPLRQLSMMGCILLVTEDEGCLVINVWSEVAIDYCASTKPLVDEVFYHLSHVDGIVESELLETDSFFPTLRLQAESKQTIQELTELLAVANTSSQLGGFVGPAEDDILYEFRL